MTGKGKERREEGGGREDERITCHRKGMGGRKHSVEMGGCRGDRKGKRERKRERGRG